MDDAREEMRKLIDVIEKGAKSASIEQALTTSIPLLQCTSTLRINRNISCSPYRFRAITILLKIKEISKNFGSVLGGRDT